MITLILAAFIFSAGAIFAFAWCAADRWHPDDDFLLHDDGES